MDKKRRFERFALALIGVAVVALYGAALLVPDEGRRKAVAGWVPLPNVTPPSAAAVTPLPAKLEEGAAGNRRGDARAITIAELRDKLDAADFDLDAIRASGRAVPRLFVGAMPRGFNKLTDVSELKHTFVKMVLPLALKVNEEILAERHRLSLLHKDMATGRPLSPKDREWLAELAERYDTPPDDLPTLLRRVDVISPALALAQSAEESGWGRSRFALRGNALFGQRVWEAGIGIVPQRRGEADSFEVRAFSTLLDSVRSYARNLNSHPAYLDFRVRRAETRARGDDLDPYELVVTLVPYSERREEYVQTIETILRVNRLQDFDRTRLKRPSVKTTLLSVGDGQR